MSKRVNLEQMVIFGEWCGKGIMKGAAICDIKDRIFAVFGVLIDNLHFIVNPKILEDILSLNNKLPEKMFILPFLENQQFVLDFSDKTKLQNEGKNINNSYIILFKVSKMNALVESIDSMDPWVFQTFGVKGVGEGLVWYPISVEDSLFHISKSAYSSLVFKTKGKIYQNIE